jgi:hypothetical protein
VGEVVPRIGIESVGCLVLEFLEKEMSSIYGRFAGGIGSQTVIPQRVSCIFARLEELLGIS